MAYYLVWTGSIKGTSSKMATWEHPVWTSTWMMLKTSSFISPMMQFRRSMKSMESLKTGISWVIQISKKYLTRTHSSKARKWTSNITSYHRSKSLSVTRLLVWSITLILRNWTLPSSCSDSISWWMMTSKFTSLRWTRTHALLLLAHCWQDSFHQSLTKHSE